MISVSIDIHAVCSDKLNAGRKSNRLKKTVDQFYSLLVQINYDRNDAAEQDRVPDYITIEFK